MGFSFRDFLEEGTAQVNPFDKGKTAKTVRSNRQAVVAQTKRVNDRFNTPEWKQLQQKASQRNVQRLNSGQIDRPAYTRQMGIITNNGVAPKPVDSFKSQNVITGGIRDFFDSNSELDKFKRRQAGQPELYRDQQIAMGNKRPYENLGAQIVGNTARFANTGAYAINAGLETARGGIADITNNEQALQASLDRQRYLREMAGDTSGGLLGTGTIYNNTDEAMNLGNAEIAKRVGLNTLGTASEVLPFARVARPVTVAGKVTGNTLRAGGKVIPTTGLVGKTVNAANLAERGASGLGTRAAFNAGIDATTGLAESTARQYAQTGKVDPKVLLGDTVASVGLGQTQLLPAYGKKLYNDSPNFKKSVDTTKKAGQKAYSELTPAGVNKQIDQKLDRRDRLNKQRLATTDPREANRLGKIIYDIDREIKGLQRRSERLSSGGLSVSKQSDADLNRKQRIDGNDPLEALKADPELAKEYDFFSNSKYFQDNDNVVKTLMELSDESTPTYKALDIIRKERGIDNISAEASKIAKRESDNAATKAAERKAAKSKLYGFTDGKSSVQKGRIEATLDKQIRYNGKVMAKRDYIKQLIQDGATVKDGVLTNADSSTPIITKTEQDYAKHLIATQPTSPQVGKTDPLEALKAEARKYKDPAVQKWLRVAETDPLRAADELSNLARGTTLAREYNEPVEAFFARKPNSKTRYDEANQARDFVLGKNQPSKTKLTGRPQEASKTDLTSPSTKDVEASINPAALKERGGSVVSVEPSTRGGEYWNIKFADGSEVMNTKIPRTQPTSPQVGKTEGLSANTKFGDITEARAVANLLQDSVTIDEATKSALKNAKDSEILQILRDANIPANTYGNLMFDMKDASRALEKLKNGQVLSPSESAMLLKSGALPETPKVAPQVGKTDRLYHGTNKVFKQFGIDDTTRQARAARKQLLDERNRLVGTGKIENGALTIPKEAQARIDAIDNAIKEIDSRTDILPSYVKEKGVYFTNDKKYAQTFAGKDGKIVEADVTLNKPYVVDESEINLIEDAAYYPDIIDKLEKQGYDGIKTKDGQQVLVFDPNNAKLATPPQVGKTANKVETTTKKTATSKLETQKSPQSQPNLSQETGNLSRQSSDKALGSTETPPVKTTPKSVKKENSTSTTSKQQRRFKVNISKDSEIPAVVYKDIPGYQSIPNEKTIAKAVQRVNADPDGTYDRLLSGGAKTLDDNADSLVLLRKLVESDELDKAQKLANATAKSGTSAGQAVQIFSAFRKTTPDGALRDVYSRINEFNKSKPNRKPIALSKEQAKEIVDLATDLQKTEYGSREWAVKAAQLERAKGLVLPSSFLAKVSQVQTMAQLLNPKTFIRNVIGNTVLDLGEDVSRISSTGIDKALYKTGLIDQRNQVLPSLKTNWLNKMTGFKQGAEDVKLGVRTTGSAGNYDLSRELFKPGSVGNKLEKALGYELSTFDKAFFTGRYQSSLENMMKAQKVKAPTAEMKVIAESEALYSTFQNNSAIAKGLQSTKRALNAGKDWGVGDLILKYPKTPGNIVSVGLDYSPVGFLKGVKGLYDGIKQKDMGKLRSGELNIGRSLTGTGLIMGGAFLATQGIITGKKDEDEDKRVADRATGNSPFSINVTALGRLLRGEDTATRPGDITANYDWLQPNAMQLSMGANMVINNGDATKQINANLESLASGIDTVTEQPVFTGVQRFIGNLDTSKGGGLGKATSEVLTDVPSSFVPSALNQVGQLTDNTRRNTYSPNSTEESLNKVLNRIPFGRQSLEPALNTLGNEQSQYDVGGNNPFNVFMNPSFVSRAKDEPTYNLANELNKSTGETSQYPRITDKKVEINGEQKQLTPEENTRYQQYVGNTTDDIYKQIESDPRFNALADTTKASLLQGFITDINAAAKINLFGNNPSTVSKTTQSLVAGDYTKAIDIKLSNTEEKASGTTKTSANKTNKTSTKKKSSKKKSGSKSAKSKYNYKIAGFGGGVDPISFTKSLQSLLAGLTIK